MDVAKALRASNTLLRTNSYERAVIGVGAGFGGHVDHAAGGEARTRPDMEPDCTLNSCTASTARSALRSG